MTAASGGQTWYKWARMRSWDRIFGIVSWNSWILFFSSASCSAVTPHWPWIRHSNYDTFPFQSRCWSRTLAILPPPLSVASPFHTAGGGKAPPGPSGRVSPGRSGTRWSGQILPLAGLKETKESGIKSENCKSCISSRGLFSVKDTLLLLSSRHLEMMVSRNTSWAAMMWSRSWARCTLFQSSSQEHSKTYTQ